MHYKSIIGALGFILIWQIIYAFSWFNPIFFASPIETFNALVSMLVSGSIVVDFSATISRLFWTILLSSLIGIPLGIVLGFFSNVMLFFEGLLDFFRSIPPIVLFPLFLIALGPEDISRIGVAIFGSFILLVLIVSGSLSGKSVFRRSFFAAMGAKKKDLILHLALFECIPGIITGLRASVSIAIIVIIVTEMLVGSGAGLGARVQSVQITSNIPDLFATIIIIGFIGFVINYALLIFDKRIFWKSNVA